MMETIEKQEAHRIIDQLQEGSTWEDLMHVIYVRSLITKGLQDLEEGRVNRVADVRAKYGLTTE